MFISLINALFTELIDVLREPIYDAASKSLIVKFLNGSEQYIVNDSVVDL